MFRRQLGVLWLDDSASILRKTKLGYSVPPNLEQWLVTYPRLSLISK